MNTYLETARFSRPYLKRYWFRFILGIILGIFFGVSNGLFIGAFYLIHLLPGDPAVVILGLGDSPPEASGRKGPSSENRPPLRLEQPGPPARRSGGTPRCKDRYAVGRAAFATIRSSTRRYST